MIGTASLPELVFIILMFQVFFGIIDSLWYISRMTHKKDGLSDI